jgi:DNA invertase Pin-like site-specific DNA recombinase
MLNQLRSGDVVAVWKLDRLSRSLKDVLHIMERIGDAGAGFRSTGRRPGALLPPAAVFSL